MGSRSKHTRGSAKRRLKRNEATLKRKQRPGGTGYAPNTKIVMSDNTEYIVTEHGNWRRLTAK